MEAMNQADDAGEFAAFFDFLPPGNPPVQVSGKKKPIAPLWACKSPSPPPQAPESSRSAAQAPNEQKSIEQKSIEQKPIEQKPIEKKPTEKKPTEKKVIGASEVSGIYNDVPDRSFGSPIITLFAGPERVPFYVHTAIISDSSAWFYARFADPRVEEHKLFLELTEDDPDIINTFVSYMYLAKPPLLTDPGDMMDFEYTISTLAKLYLLGVRFEIKKLEVKANKEMFERLDRENDDRIRALGEEKFKRDLQTRIATIREVYTKTTNVDDPLRKTLVTNMASHWECYRGKGGLLDNEDGTETELGRFVEECPRFTKDLLRHLKNGISIAPPPRASLGKKRKVGD